MHSLQTLARLALAALALVATPAARAFDWSIAITPDDALYPVFDLSQGRKSRDTRPDAAIVGRGTGLVQVERVAARDGERVALAIRSPWLAQPAVLEATLARSGERYRLRPALAWNAASLARLAKPEAIALDVELAVDGQHERRSQSARLHPLGEALYYVRAGKDEVDLGWIFAAYADPNSAVVDAILDAARARHPDLPFDTRRRSRADTLALAFAIWEVLERHGLRYADEDPGVARGPTTWSQRVRLHDDVWRERRANCLDGSLLIAAALERIGIGGALILVPGHALVAFHAEAGDDTPLFVETTLLGRRGLPARPRAAFANRINGYDPAAMTSFDAALAAGRARYARESRGFARRNPDYQWIDLPTARAYGIIPLAAGSDANVSAAPAASPPR
jgi:hypothetical protein